MTKISFTDEIMQAIVIVSQKNQEKSQAGHIF